MEVEIAYARPEKQRIVTVQVPEDATMLEAVKQSGIPSYFPRLIWRRSTWEFSEKW